MTEVAHELEFVSPEEPDDITTAEVAVNGLRLINGGNGQDQSNASEQSAIVTPTQLRYPHETFIGKIKATPLLTPEETIQLAHRVQSGDEAARWEMIASNILLVQKVAGKIAQARHISVEDLVQAGILNGLYKAVDKFDPTRNIRFSTYAMWWIKQAIHVEAAATGRSIKLTDDHRAMLRDIMKISDELTAELKREPSVDEVADYLQVDPDDVKTLLVIGKDARSLEEPVLSDDEGEVSLHITIGVEEDYAAVEDTVDSAVRRKALLQAIKRLDAQERQVVAKRLGIGENAPLTLNAIGELMGMGAVKVREIEKRSHEKLSNDPELARLAKLGQ
jgi:RNA polymerase primary sigma factor